MVQGCCGNHTLCSGTHVLSPLGFFCPWCIVYFFKVILWSKMAADAPAILSVSHVGKKKTLSLCAILEEQTNNFYLIGHPWLQ